MRMDSTGYRTTWIDSETGEVVNDTPWRPSHRDIVGRTVAQGCRPWIVLSDEPGEEGGRVVMLKAKQISVFKLSSERRQRGMEILAALCDPRGGTGLLSQSPLGL
jgi:hypothetical protein